MLYVILPHETATVDVIFLTVVVFELLLETAKKNNPA
jgi:hypothetical protein